MLTCQYEISATVTWIGISRDEVAHTKRRPFERTRTRMRRHALELQNSNFARILTIGMLRGMIEVCTICEERVRGERV